MHHHRLVISYKGTHYFGWQDLGTSEQKPTIEASVKKVLDKISKHGNCSISAASRTDAGVHAQGQSLKITMAIALNSEKLLLGMNSLLPDDIRVLQCEPCVADFNPNKDSKSKEYHYYFCTDYIDNPILSDVVAHIPIAREGSAEGLLDIKLMQQACSLFVGKHDFYNFAKRDKNIAATIRTLISCEILQTPSLPLGSSTYCLRIVGSGFLSHMVRYIAGALFALGKHQISLSEITDALIKHEEYKISPKAKARGLHLVKVCY